MKIILLLFSVILLNAKTLIATYEAKYGFFTIAKAKGIFEYNSTNYKIFTSMWTLGIAKALSKNLTQTYTSIGIIRNGILIPKKYISVRKNSTKSYKTIYLFDHKNKKIRKIRYKNGNLEFNKTFGYYTPNDILSLYFNFPKYLKNLPKKGIYTFYALGARKKDGKIDISIIESKNNIKLKVNLYNKVFVGDKGILYLTINPTNWVTIKGVVKNVLKIGDLKGKITSFKEK